MNEKKLFSLDIGTRSVIGIVAQQAGKTMKILAVERKEHNTRAMLDGQIHDVPEVAAILDMVRTTLEQEVGPLTEAAVAAAGRALYTITAEAHMDVSDLLTLEDEHALEFMAIQAAQKKLATSNMVDDPTLYYCVGYSTIYYKLDGTQLKSLVGQRGKAADIQVIATFLPRQVIDSMQSALHEAKLEMTSLTLEPIAAINVLIPPTMRHLNLVLVDIGAGTSDVAVTKNSTVIGYGMVPLAGDEITEAISQNYLLDFNVAESIKRELNHASAEKKIEFTDILGLQYQLAPDEILKQIKQNIADLAQAIAAQIIALNKEAPQAVLLVGGGALTPLLPEMLAQALDMPPARVAVRTPDQVSGIETVPEELKTPDSVTPLGILKIASSQNLNFITVKVNKNEHRLFNISKLTVTDALLAEGISLRELSGKPGLGLTLTINDRTKFIAGTLGRPAMLRLNGEPASLDAEIHNGDELTVVCGVDGQSPAVYLKDVVDVPDLLHISINGTPHEIAPILLLNGQETNGNPLLNDRDVITFRPLKNLGEILVQSGFVPTPRKYNYTINGEKYQHSASVKLLVNQNTQTVSYSVQDGDEIAFIEPNAPRLGEVLELDAIAAGMKIYFNKKEVSLPTATYTVKKNQTPVSLDDLLEEGCALTYEVTEKSAPILSDVLLAVDFKPPGPLSKVRVDILINNEPAEYISPVKGGDSIDVIITDLSQESLFKKKEGL